MVRHFVPRDHRGVDTTVRLIEMDIRKKVAHKHCAFQFPLPTLLMLSVVVHDPRRQGHLNLIMKNIDISLWGCSPIKQSITSDPHSKIQIKKVQKSEKAKGPKNTKTYRYTKVGQLEVQPKKNPKINEKTVPNLKFALAFGFLVFSGFLWYFFGYDECSVFFRYEP